MSQDSPIPYQGRQRPNWRPLKRRNRLITLYAWMVYTATPVKLELLLRPWLGAATDELIRHYVTRQIQPGLKVVRPSTPAGLRLFWPCRSLY